MRKELGIGGRAAQCLGSEAAFGQKGPQPLGLARDKGKRLNGNNFSNFPRVPCGFSQGIYLPFRNLWFLFSKRSCPSLRKLFKQLTTTSGKLDFGLTG
jgi:hypothetical protein